MGFRHFSWFLTIAVGELIKPTLLTFPTKPNEKVGPFQRGETLGELL